MEHKQCRTDLLKLYKEHITAWRSLDNWVWEWHREVLLFGNSLLGIVEVGEYKVHVDMDTKSGLP